MITEGPTGKNCNQQHAGNDCWGIWRTDADVPAYCIDTHVFSPYWNSGSLAANACADTYDTSCQVRVRAPEQFALLLPLPVVSPSTPPANFFASGPVVPAGH